MKNNKWRNGLIQIGCILLASLLIAGATWQIGQSASAQAAFERDGRPEGRGESNDGHDHDHDHGDEHGGDGRSRDDHHSADISLRGIAGFGETIVKMTVVIGAIVLGQRAWASVRNRQAT